MNLLNKSGKRSILEGLTKELCGANNNSNRKLHKPACYILLDIFFILFKNAGKSEVLLHFTNSYFKAIFGVM